MLATLLEPTVVALLALMVGVPLLTLVHELGHGIAAALVVGGRVTIVQGNAPFRVAFSIWRLDVRLHGPVAPHRGMVGWALWGAHPSRRRQVLATAAGPVTSLGSTLACLGGAAETGSTPRLFLLYLALASTLQTLSSALPVRYGRWFGQFAGEASDGLRVRRLLQGRPEPPPVVS